jgi:hypothetical protein
MSPVSIFTFYKMSFAATVYGEKNFTVPLYLSLKDVT